ncbi:FtsX-like permease family protein [Rhodocytophaga rosea]|uniref:FtsX-like permease family protein n=1 Tax=Rhodocytophaga rosea TaxID=2704465 RepID=A0A6C0GUW0_9BACT|nr:ABC transporter permease [Rhodocytophaga rosea]QHT71343.1 FtsX-like permease family protein [Rhodocytophaga rosea]
MLIHYLKIALRNLRKQKIYTLINILGLSIGLASCVLIILFVMEHLDFDAFHQNADRIYRVNYKGKLSADSDAYHIGATPPPVAKTLINEFPEVELATRIQPKGINLIRYQDKTFMEPDVIAVDSNFFKIFSFRLKKGNPAKVFSEPNAVIITEKMAAKYFGMQEPMGKILSFGDARTPYKVAGIAENPPYNSHFTFHMLTSISSEEQVKNFDWSWVYCSLTTYVQLKNGANPQNLEAKFPGMVRRHAGNTIGRLFNTTIEDFQKGGNSIELSLQPLQKIHLYSAGIGSGLGTHGDIKYLYIFSCVAFFILLLACVNFMNLSTARSAGRSKEVGVRKVLGSVKSQLIIQFLTESMVTCLIAMLFAIAMGEIFLLFFKDFLFDGLDTNLLNQNWLWLSLLLLIFVVGIIAGSYPAFYLSAFKPVEVLKGKLRMGMKSSLIRSTLVVFQFGISVCLIICTLFVFRQLTYLSQVNMGFDKENVLVLSNTDRLGNNMGAFKQTLLQLPQVQSASYSTNLPSAAIDSDLFEPEDAGTQEKILEFITADYDYLQTLNIHVKEGRSFSRDFPSDADEEEGAMLINESAAKLLGWENPIGKHLLSLRDGNNRKIIGVIKDFNFKSLHSPIAPLLILLAEQGDYMTVKVKPGETRKTLQAIEAQWKKQVDSAPFEYSFLDERINQQYQAEEKIGQIFTLFTSLAIFIACLGLFGLAAYTTEQRSKEIGIRKVLGASIWGVVHLLSKDFLKLVLIANLIAWPLAWYVMSRWLEDFAYQISLDAWVFILAGMMAIVTALLTVLYQAVKAAHTNPVESLRSE